MADACVQGAWWPTRRKRNTLCRALHGNTFSFCSFNVSSLTKYMSLLSLLLLYSEQFDAITSQETKLTQVGQKRMDLRSQKWDVVFGAPQPHRTSATDGQYGGVAVNYFALRQWRPEQHGLMHLEFPKRITVATVPIDSGRRWFHVISVYGFPQATERRPVEETLRRNQLLFQEVAALAAALGAVPVAVCDDFNMETTQGPVRPCALRC